MENKTVSQASAQTGVPARKARQHAQFYSYVDCGTQLWRASMGKKQFLAALMLTVLLTGCGGSGKAAATQKDPVQVQTGYTAEMEQDANTDSINDAAVSVSSVDEKKQAALPDEGRADQEKTDLRKTLSRDGYTLQQVVVLSRHNIRSPLSGSGSELEELTPHEWISWSSNPSELSLRGGALETVMGQYFRKWTEEAGLFPENYQPEEGAVRIYANAKQRTLATANFFATGLLPLASPDVETHAEYDSMDPTFKPQLTFVSDTYIRDVEEQVKELHGKEIAGLEDNYRLLEDVIDMKDSPAWQKGEVGPLRTDDTELILQMNAEPNLSGSLKTAGKISDALVLQYYEEPDEKEAAFGHTLTQDQWRMVSEVKDTYQEILFATPLIAVNAAHPLLREISDELAVPGRKFTFLCGHDSNIGSVLAAIGAEDYTLPDSIEKKVPIGCKLVFSRWTDKDADEWTGLDMVYQTADQLRGLTLLDIDTPPAIVPISLGNMDRNEDDLYASQELEDRLEQAIDAYEKIKEKYAQ